MSDQHNETQKQAQVTKPQDGKRPQTRPRPKPQATTQPTPRANVPPQGGPLFGRPLGGGPAHRQRRAALRHGQPTGTLTAKKAAAGEGEIIFYGSIGSDWYGEGITDVGFQKALKDLGDVSTIRVKANSGGGDVFTATAIYNMLIKHWAKIIIEIEGVAGSAMTLVAMAGDEIHISENAHFMIHAASGIAWGNADQLRQYLKLLDNADELIRLTYSRRTGISNAELVGMMDHDNWMTAQEAFDLGFVDTIDEAKTVEPHTSPDKPANDSADHPTLITPERLAAMSDSLLSLAASTGFRVAASANNPGASAPPIPKESANMKAKMRAKCIAAGMPEATTGEAAEAWLELNFDKVMGTSTGAAVAGAGEGQGSGTGGEATAISVTALAAAIDNVITARENRKAKERADWRAECDATISLVFGEQVPEDLAWDCYALRDQGITAVRTKIQEAKKKVDDATSTGGGYVNLAPNQPQDRHLAAIRAGVMARSLSNFRTSQPVLKRLDNGNYDFVTPSAADLLEKHLPEKERPNGWQDFSRMPMQQIAHECLLAEGYRHEMVRTLAPAQICQMAMGFGPRIGLRNEAALHTIGSLLFITQDAVNKTVQAAYAEAPSTWRGPMRQAQSVPDFKQKHVIRLGAAANLPVWNDGLPPELAMLSNEEVKYAVEARAETLSFSWRTFLMDDTDTLFRRPQLLATAAGRTVNAVAWRQVTSNPTMSDAQPLFLETATGLRFRSNLTTGTATPTNTTISAMGAKMAQMRGLNTPEGAESEDILGLTARYISGPTTLRNTILKEVRSSADPAAGGNSGVYNTSQDYIPVIEPLLDASSVSAWYTSADPSLIDGVEVTFMQGYESPVAHEYVDQATMSQNFTIVIIFEAKATEHRGWQKHNGV